MNLLSSWSGGKDSCYALMLAIQQGHTSKALLNMMNENGRVSRSHAIPAVLLDLQAEALGLPMHKTPASWADYEKNYIEALTHLKKNYLLDGAVFGDIDLQPHREWEEKVCHVANIQALLPLWQQDRKALVLQMIAAGIEAVIVSCNTSMGPAFLGRKIEPALLEELEKINVDACGENGEYHTLVSNCPLFKQPLNIRFGNRQVYKDYCFIEMEPDHSKKTIAQHTCQQKTN